MTIPTGVVTQGCYAASYRDCDGGPLTKEHWITKRLLELVQDDGSGLHVTGLSFAGGQRDMWFSELQSRILCEKHNTILSELDVAIVALHNAWLAIARGQPLRTEISGHKLERWALKVLVGGAASGVLQVDGNTIRSEPSQPVLDALFGLRQLPSPCGFHFEVHGDREDGMKIGFVRPPPDHPEAGLVFGIRLQVRAFRFLTWLSSRGAPPFPNLFYRPAGLDFGSGSRLGFEWSDGPATRDIPFTLKITE